MRSVLVMLMVAGTAELATADDWRVLNENDVPELGILRSWLREQTHAALDLRQQRVDQLNTRKDIVQYRSNLQQQFIESLGEFPERTPLNARIVDRFDGDGYRGEKVIYERRPGFYVPAILYLPDAKPPHPAVLLLCGHSENGKAASAYQQACILLAKNGLAVLCPDPIGQGERTQILLRRVDGHIIDPNETHDLVQQILNRLMQRLIAACSGDQFMDLPIQLHRVGVVRWVKLQLFRFTQNAVKLAEMRARGERF